MALKANARALAIGYPPPLLVGLDPRSVERLAVVLTDPASAHAWPVTQPSCALVAAPAQLPFAESLFDGALLVHALEHAPDPHACLRELWRVLAPAGYLVLIVPSRAGRLGGWLPGPFDTGHGFGRRELTALLEDALFEPLSWRSVLAAPPLRLARSLDRLLLRLAPALGGVHLVLARKTDGLGGVTIAAEPRVEFVASPSLP